jgi:hypothetical protein
MLKDSLVMTIGRHIIIFYKFILYAGLGCYSIKSFMVKELKGLEL